MKKYIFTEGKGTYGSNAKSTTSDSFVMIEDTTLLEGFTLPWNSITNKPTAFPPTAHEHSASDITSGTLSYARLPFSSTNVNNWNTAYSWGNHANQGYLKTVSWSDLTGKPTSFPPSSHTHTWSEITGKPTFAPSDAEKNVQSDWNETNTSSDAFIQNKPSLNFFPLAGGSLNTDSRLIFPVGNTDLDFLNVRYNNGDTLGFFWRYTGTQTGNENGLELHTSTNLAYRLTQDGIFNFNKTPYVNTNEIYHEGNLTNLSQLNNDLNFISEVTWNNVLNKPTTFTPSAHTHSISQITNLQTTLNSKANTSDLPTKVSELENDEDFLKRDYGRNPTYRVLENSANRTYLLIETNITVDIFVGYNFHIDFLSRSGSSGRIFIGGYAHSNMQSPNTALSVNKTEEEVHVFYNAEGYFCLVVKETNHRREANITSYFSRFDGKITNAEWLETFEFPQGSTAQRSRDVQYVATEDFAVNYTQDYTANNYVPLEGATTKNGTLTLTSPPVIPNATLDSHAVNRGYADGRYSLLGHGHNWSEISGKPSTFSPSNHTHNSIEGVYRNGGRNNPSDLGGGNLRLEMIRSDQIGGLSYTWNDVLWLSSYNGGDVKGSNALIFGKQTDFIGFARQNFDSNSWGTVRQIWHSGNLTKLSQLQDDIGAGSGASEGYVLKSGDTMTGKLIISSGTYQDHLELVRGSIKFELAPSTGNSGELRFLATNATRYIFDKDITAPKVFATSATGSLRELKKNIRPYENSALKVWRDIEISWFDYKDESTLGMIGPMADDDSTSNDILTEDNKAVNLYNAIFVAGKAIKEQDEIVQEQESRIKTLEERIERLEKMIYNG